MAAPRWRRVDSAGRRQEGLERRVLEDLVAHRRERRVLEDLEHLRQDWRLGTMRLR
jgi:hypothetical protein